jgi:hypothetical protein
MALLNKESAIVVDAVLTDLGRQKIAKNDRSFNIVAFCLADDEIDYTNWNPNTGSAFIDSQILSTPVFEASVNEKLSINFPLMTITNPNLKYIPTLEADATSISIGEEKGLSAGAAVRFYQNTNQNARVVPVEIQDATFKIEMPNDLLNVENEIPVDVTPYGTAIYILTRDAALIQSSQGSQITFKVRPQSLNNQIWGNFGIGVTGSRTITTKVKATGLNSGLSKYITITINEEFTR